MALDVEEAIRTIPFLDEILLQEGGFEMSSLLDRAFQQFSTVVLEFIKRSFTGFTTALFHFVFVLFILFFLFLEGERLLDKIRSLIPLNEEDTEELVRDVANTTRATVVSTLIIGILEGTYGGVIFFLFGIPSPALWGIIIMIVSMIPVIGSNIIIVPAGILEIVTGEYLSGIVIILMGLGGVAVSQNILRPKLLGGRSGMHPMIVLLATLGGIAWLGLVGFLVGPMIASLFIVIWHQFAKKYKSRAEEAAEEAAE
jgi:predicted PurR-regulated permease PerM